MSMAIHEWGSFVGGIAAGVTSAVVVLNYLSGRKENKVKQLEADFEKQRTLELREQRLESDKAIHELRRENAYISDKNKKHEERIERMSRIMDDYLQQRVHAIAPGFNSLLDTIDELQYKVEQEQQSQQDTNAQLQLIKTQLQETKLSLASLPSFVEFNRAYKASGEASSWLMNERNREAWAYDAADASKKRHPSTLGSGEAYDKLLRNINQCLGWLAFSLQEYKPIESPEGMLESLKIETEEVHQFALQWLLDERVMPRLPRDQATEVSNFLNLLLQCQYWSNGSFC